MYYKQYDNDFSESNETKGRFVGILEHVGHALTYKVLTETRQVIHRSRIHSAAYLSTHNLRIDDKLDSATEDMPGLQPIIETACEATTVDSTSTDGGQSATVDTPVHTTTCETTHQNPTSGTTPTCLHSRHDADLANGATFSTIDFDNLIGRTFLLPPEDDGQWFRAKIIH